MLVVLPLVAILSACGSTVATAHSSPLGGGYLATAGGIVTFIQVEQQGSSDNYTGAVDQVSIAGTPPDATTTPKSGSVSMTVSDNGRAVTMMMSPGSLLGSPLFGDIRNSLLTIRVPQPDGTIQPVIFRAATVDTYNSAVDTLESQASAQNASYERQQEQAQQQQSQQAQQAMAPSSDAISNVLERTVEVADPSTRFSSSQQPLTISDGQGGYLTALVATRSPSADGKGQLVFFWHDGSFTGWDSDHESKSILGVTSSNPGGFNVTYATYATSDPLCCPSLPPTVVTYTWNGQGYDTSGNPPDYTSGPPQVKLLSQ